VSVEGLFDRMGNQISDIDSERIRQLIAGTTRNPEVSDRMLAMMKEMRGDEGPSKGAQQRWQEMHGMLGDPATMRDAIRLSEDPNEIEMLIEGSNVSEDDAALGKAKLEAMELYGTGKGRVHDYADGSQEWVPEGMAITGRAPFMIREGPTTQEEEAPRGQSGISLANTLQLLRDSAGQFQPSARIDKNRQQLIREAQGYQEGGLAAVTGVGEPKMKEDDDQPLVQKPGNLISRTLSRIRKAFGFAEGGLVRYATGGRVGFPNGGLATAAGFGDDEEDEEDQPSLIQESLGRAQRITMNKEKALRRLTAGRDAILAQERDKSSKWLALAQGMLAPTKTGGFGESLGTTAGLLGKERTEAQEFELDRSERLREIEGEMADVEAKAISQEQAEAKAAGPLGGRALHGAIQTVVHPEDTEKDVEDQRLILAAARKDGSIIHLKDPKTGDFIFDADRQDPARRAAIQRAILEVEGEEGRAQEDIVNAIVAMQGRRDIARGMEILSTGDPTTTSGWQKMKTQFAEWVGFELSDTVDLAELQTILGQDYIRAMEAFTGPKSDRDVAEAKSLAAGIQRNTTLNWRRLQRMAGILDRVYQAGVRAAYDRDDRDALFRLEFDPDLPLVTTKEERDELPAGQAYYRTVGGQKQMRGED
jgi:hypothetical protein